MVSMDRQENDIYEAVKRGYLPAPERRRGYGGRWVFEYPPGFQEMLGFYRELRRTGRRGREMHFAMWWRFGWWHEGAKAYVVHITTNLAKAARILIPKEGVQRKEVKKLHDLVSTGPQFKPVIKKDLSLDDVNDFMEGLWGLFTAVFAGETLPLDEETRKEWCQKLFEPAIQEQVINSPALLRMHLLLEDMDVVSRRAGQSDYDRARQLFADYWERCEFREHYGFVFSLFPDWLARQRSTVARYLRPLRRSPLLVLFALSCVTTLLAIQDIQGTIKTKGSPP
jgi:hypothetical protein